MISKLIRCRLRYDFDLDSDSIPGCYSDAISSDFDGHTCRLYSMFMQHFDLLFVDSVRRSCIPEPVASGGSQNNSECVLGIVLGLPRIILGAWGFVLGTQYKPGGVQYSPGGHQNNSECRGIVSGYARGVLVFGACGFALGAQFKRAGAQYSPGVPKTTLNAPLGWYWVIPERAQAPL